MYHVVVRKNRLEQRKVRIRKKLMMSLDTPRLSVYRSNKYISAQVIDDAKGVTLASATSQTLKSVKGKTKVEQSLEIGKEIAKKAIEKKVKKVVFDRSGYRYHGRVKAVAEGAREGGLKF